MRKQLLIPGNIWNTCALAKRRKIVLEGNHASASSSRREPRPSVEEFAQNRLEGFSSGGSAAFLPPSCEESLRGVERTLCPAPPALSPASREIFQEDHRRRTLRLVRRWLAPDFTVLTIANDAGNVVVEYRMAARERKREWVVRKK